MYQSVKFMIGGVGIEHIIRVNKNLCLSQHKYAKHWVKSPGKLDMGWRGT